MSHKKALPSDHNSSTWLFLSFRLLSVFLVRTFFVADEYWQSLEVAHKIVFSYGHLTWEWNHALRSPIYPLFLSTAYKLLQFTKTDSYWNVIYAPRILQAALTAGADCCFYKICVKRFGLPRQWTLLTMLTNWFYFYCGSRTLINTFETNLVVFALYYFPWSSLTTQTLSSCVVFASIVCCNCLIRPTACVLWMPFCLYWMYVSTWNQRKNIILVFMIVGAVTLLTFFPIETIFYKKLTWTFWNFLMFNVFHGISSFYGTHPFHWYLLQGLPVVLGIHVGPCVAQFINFVKGQGMERRRLYHVKGIMIFTITCSTLLLSCLPHKEFRFLLPLCPLAMFLVIEHLSWIVDRRRKRQWVAALVLGMIVPSVVFGWSHQRGILPTMRHLAAAQVNDQSRNISILFLVPCHSMPLYSHLHTNVTTRFISCEPPLTPHSYDESEEFFADPNNWLRREWKNLFNIPGRVVLYDSLLPQISQVLKEHDFVEDATFPHTSFPQNRISGEIIVLRRKKM